MKDLVHKRYNREKEFLKGSKWYVFAKCKKNILLSTTSFRWEQVTCEKCLSNKYEILGSPRKVEK